MYHEVTHAFYCVFECITVCATCDMSAMSVCVRLFPELSHRSLRCLAGFYADGPVNGWEMLVLHCGCSPSCNAWHDRRTHTHTQFNALSPWHIFGEFLLEKMFQCLISNSYTTGPKQQPWALWIRDTYLNLLVPITRPGRCTERHTHRWIKMNRRWKDVDMQHGTNVFFKSVSLYSVCVLVSSCGIWYHMLTKYHSSTWNSSIRAVVGSVN